MRALVISFAVLASAAPAFADPVGDSGDFSRGFGMGYDNFDRPFEPSTRDENGNRVILNGRMQIEGTLTGGLMDGDGGGYGNAQAIGNQLNVITQGNWNTVIIDSTQINNGDVSAEVRGED